MPLSPAPHSGQSIDVSVQISKTRRVQISQYSGKHMLNIREYYEKDGKMLPGKKVGSELLLWQRHA